MKSIQTWASCNLISYRQPARATKTTLLQPSNLIINNENNNNINYLLNISYSYDIYARNNFGHKCDSNETLGSLDNIMVDDDDVDDS